MKPIHYPHSNFTDEEAVALSTKFEKITITQVSAAFESSGLGFSVTGIIKPSSWSTRHAIYIVEVAETDEQFIFRSNVGYGDKPEVVLVREKLMTDAARDAGVLCNEIIHADVSRSKVPFDFQIQRKVIGQDLEDHFVGSQSEYDDLSIQLGELTARLHNIKLEGFGRFDYRSTDQQIKS